MDTTRVEPADPLVEKLEATIRGLMWTKRRYPLLAAVKQEWASLTDTMQRRSGVNEPPRPRNDAVLQLVRDTFDMLVIDLVSLREGFMNSHGFLQELQKQPERIRQCSASEITTAKDGSESVDLHYGRPTAKRINEAIVRLFGPAFPVTSDAVKALIKKFCKDTKPLHEDRNRARAHRFEGQQFDPRFFQPLSALPSHIETFDSYVRDLYLVLTRRPHPLEYKAPYLWDTTQTAQDLADIMMHGSISVAVESFGVARPEGDTRPLRYYWSRARFFETT